VSAYAKFGDSDIQKTVTGKATFTHYKKPKNEWTTFLASSVNWLMIEELNGIHPLKTAPPPIVLG